MVAYTLVHCRIWTTRPPSPSSCTAPCPCWTCPPCPWWWISWFRIVGIAGLIWFYFFFKISLEICTLMQSGLWNIQPPSSCTTPCSCSTWPPGPCCRLPWFLKILPLDSARKIGLLTCLILCIICILIGGPEISWYLPIVSIVALHPLHFTSANLVL